MKITTQGLQSWSTYSQLWVQFCLLWCCWYFPNPVTSYSLKNCTIKYIINVTNMKVLCSQRDLEVFPNDIPSNVTLLDISYNYISKFMELDINIFTNLKELNMYSNNISHLDDGAFSGLLALQVLNLGKNQLTSLSGHIFHGLDNLIVLVLSENHITTITQSSIQVLSTLKELYLFSNRLRHTESVEAIFSLPDLQVLDIADNLFDSFQSSTISNKSTGLRMLDVTGNPFEIFSLTTNVFPQLQTLDISHCGPYENGSMEWDVSDQYFLRNVLSLDLTHVYMSVEMISMLIHSLNSSLEQLKLNYQAEFKLQTLVNEACEIPTLRTLHLKYNNIRKDLLLSCTHLTELDLSDSDILELTELSFRQMKSLRILSLSNNKLPSVPKGVRNLPTLEVLDLSGNMITTLESSDLFNLTRLRKLYLQENEITTLNDFVFQDLGALKTLELGINHILTLGDAFKNGLVKLESLNLHHNPLIIRRGEFESLVSLETLNLSFIPNLGVFEQAFDGLTKLRTLDLSSCGITSLGQTLLWLTGLKTLNVSNNNMYFGLYTEQPFSNLTSLENLVMDSQGLSELPSIYLQGLKSLLTLSVKNFRFNSLQSDTFVHTPKLRSLDISNNDLSENDFTVIFLELFQAIPHLEKLYMSDCGLQSLEFLFPVEHNIFSKNNEVTLPSLPALNLLDVQRNPFICDCSNAFFIQWAGQNSQTQVVEGHQYLCKYPVVLKGSALLDLDTHPCWVEISFFYFISTTSLVLLTLLGSFIYHLLRWQVVYAYYLFLAYLYDTKRRKQRVPHQYDAFVSYNAHDEPWVLGELLPELEGKQGWRLCLHHRDFQPGKLIIDNITDAIYGSRKTICVISHQYLESEWCSREIHVASFRLFEEQKDVLILVFLEEIPDQQLSPYHRMRRLVKRRTYLSWPRDGEHPEVFWQKLHMALETRDCPAEERPILTGVEL